MRVQEVGSITASGSGEGLLQAPPLAFWALFGVLGLEMHPCLHLHAAFSRVHVCILTSPFYKDSHTGWGPSYSV